MDLSKLSDPFDPKDIEWRPQRTGQTNGKYWLMLLAYINNRAIMDRLDEVCGRDKWVNKYKDWHVTSQLCGISIKIGDDWITKWDGADNTNIESTKGGLSDAMKRAAVQWGIGRYLYKLDTTFAYGVFEDPKDDNHLPYYDSKVGKRVYYPRPKLPSWAMPGVKE